MKGRWKVVLHIEIKMIEATILLSQRKNVDNHNLIKLTQEI